MIVYLPPGYHAKRLSGIRCSTSTMGRTSSIAATSFGEEWRVDETAQQLIIAGRIEPVIVVGVYNTGVHRVDEYTPTARPDKGGGGHADDYGRMLVEELKPFIDATYRTAPDAANTAMGGSSLGGFLTLTHRAAVPRPPSGSWPRCRRRFGGTTGTFCVRSTLPRRHPARQRIWLDAGTREGR